MEKRLEQLPKLAQEAKKESKKYFARLKKRTPKNLDYIMQELHDEEFSKTDCLDCGNCCKTTSPIFTDKDIERISKHLKMKVANFVNQYLIRDEDDFMVLVDAGRNIHPKLTPPKDLIYWLEDYGYMTLDASVSDVRGAERQYLELLPGDKRPIPFVYMYKITETGEDLLSGLHGSPL